MNNYYEKAKEFVINNIELFAKEIVKKMEFPKEVFDKISKDVILSY